MLAARLRAKQPVSGCRTHQACVWIVGPGFALRARGPHVGKRERGYVIASQSVNKRPSYQQRGKHIDLLTYCAENESE